MRFHLACLGVLATSMFTNPNLAVQNVSTIKSDEVIVFFPTVARLSDAGSEWFASVQGCVFEPEKSDVLRRAAITTLLQGLNIDGDTLKGAIFEERIRAFLVDNERGKRIKIRVADQNVVLEPSTPSGLFVGSFQIDRKATQSDRSLGQLRYKAVLRESDRRAFEGTIYLVGRDGISVISDIDDTIKVTEVRDKHKVFENTFLKPFQPVEGMAPKYRRWSEQGIAFHYLSNGPWQLYQPIWAFLQSERFPEGAVSLREFRVKDESFWTFVGADPQQAKTARIEHLLRDFSRRKFVLVGDSGERDPETYAAIARRFPNQVHRVFIRDVTNEARDSPRYKQVFRGVPADRWEVFQEPQSLPDRL